MIEGLVGSDPAADNRCFGRRFVANREGGAYFDSGAVRIRLRGGMNDTERPLGIAALANGGDLAEADAIIDIVFGPPPSAAEAHDGDAERARIDRRHRPGPAL